jgi:hypothetical protein
MASPEMAANGGKFKQTSLWLAMGGVLAVAVLVVTVAARWPFTRTRVAYALQQASGREVRMGRFHQTFFPYPGFVAENVEIHQAGSENSPLLTAGALTVQDSWANRVTFRRRIDRLDAEKLHIQIFAHHEKLSGAPSANQGKITVRELVANGAVLDIARHGGNGTLRFVFPQLALHEVGRESAIRFSTVLSNPNPPGVIKANGTFGPWHSGNGGLTPVSGQYRFENADLGHYHGIAGTLSSDGQFSGTLGRIEVRDKADVPNFEVTSSGHTVALRTEFRAIVNGLNGDTSLNEIRAHFLRTSTIWRGEVAGKPGQSGKTASFELASVQARVQDLMRIVSKAPQPPLEGPIVFRGHVVLPPIKERFLRKLRLQGDFDITHARFTNPVTQTKVSLLSARASGENKRSLEENPRDIACELKGAVSVRDGVANFSLLTVTMPGAIAQLEGSFNLINQSIDLQGTLATEASLSHDAGGIKSVLLKPLNPLFKKKPAGAVIPVKIGGTYSHPTYGLALTAKK